MLLFVVLINDPSFLLSSRRKKFSSLLWSQTSNCFSLVAEFHLKCWDVSISPLQAYSFRCWFSNNSIQSFFARMLSKFICGRNCHFLLRPFYPNNLASILSFRRHCDVALFTNHLVLSRSCSFRAYPFNQSVVFSFKLFHLIKFCFSFQPECCLKSFLPIMPFFQ